MIEPELAFADVFDVMECAEAYVQFCIKFILENNKDDLDCLEKRKPGHLKYLENIVSQPFAKASYTEAIGILQKVLISIFRSWQREWSSKKMSHGEMTWAQNTRGISVIMSSIVPSSFTTTPNISRHFI